MANIKINGAVYEDVPSIEVPNESGEMVEFEESISNSIVNRTIREYKKSDITSIGAYAFCYAEKLVSINLPNAISVGIYGFCNCYSLVSINLPNAISVGNYGFFANSVLAEVDLPKCKAFNNAVFYECVSLKKLILRAESVVSLTHSNAFSSTPIASGTGYIYVPSALIDSYKTATNWSVYASQFRALEDYTVDGTTTGELDESKI